MPRDADVLQRAQGALHRFAEWLEVELDGALRAARGRQLAPLRHVVQACRFLHQRYVGSDPDQAVDRPTDLTVEADLPLGLKQLDADTLADCVNGMAAAADALTPFEGLRFERKPLDLDKSSDNPAARGKPRALVAETDCEATVLADLKTQVKMLTALVHAEVARFSARVAASSPGQRTAPGDDQPLYSPPELAEKTGFSEDNIYAWINSGELEASDVSKKRGGKPHYVISQEAYDRFMKNRQVTKPTKVTRKRRNKADDGVTKFFG